MNTPPLIEVTEGRRDMVIRKANEKGYETLNEAELAVIHAYDAGTLRVLPNDPKLSQFYQKPIDVPTLAELRTVAATVSVEQMHEFLRQRYKADRFEGRNNATWGTNYSRAVAQSAVDALEQHGFGLISQYESNTGESIHYDGRLQVISLEQWREYVDAELAEERAKRAAAAPLPAAAGSSNSRGRGR